MGIGSYILAGALQGAGNGIAQQGASAIEERRQQALEALRAQNQRDNAEYSASLNDQNAARKAKRDAYYTNERLQTQGGLQEQTDNRRAGIAVKIEGVRQKNRVALEGLQHTFRLNEDATSFARTADLKAKEANDQIDRWDVDQNGNMVGFSKTGRIFRSNVKLQRKGEDDGDLTLPGSPRATPSATPSAVPTAAPARPRVAPRAADPADEAAPTDTQEMFAKEYGAGAPDSAFPSGASAALGKTYSIADLRETARSNNMSIADTRKWLAERGYKLAK